MSTRIWMVAGLAALAAACGGEATQRDAGPPDGPPADAGTACTDNSDCNNGFFCDGEETCGPDGTCRGGDAIACDDGIACTTDVCSDELRECVFAPRDADRDGRVDVTCTDAGGAPLGDDCDDNDNNRFPGNIERCDELAHDEDCDPQTFGEVDVDGDNAFSDRCCNGAVCGTDCDDQRAATGPGVNEVCDGLDNDCDGTVDDGVAATVYADLDGDGAGAGAPIAACADAPRTSTNDDDCDDNDRARHPGQLEICDGRDNNCDGTGAGGVDQIDENAVAVNWYVDADGDGFGDPAPAPIFSCIPVNGRSLLDTDCDDGAPAVSPVAAEQCDGRDNDCNGLADFRIGVNDFEDDDADTLVDNECVGGTDCDDADAATGLGGIEQCDGRDNDCDDAIDEGAVDTLWFRDNDNDGFGSASSGAVVACEGPAGFSASGGDCDDSDEARYPNAAEACDALDQDCDSAVDEAPATQSCGDGINASGRCEDGACVVVCDPGFDDCNRNPADGCESSLDNGASCGACGVSCEQGGMTGLCVGGACQCVPGFGDCNGDPADGCEVNLQTNVGNCGTCDNFCSIDNGAGVCAGGTCQVGACFEGWAQCDNDRGCETDVTLNTRCGDCTTDCTDLPNVPSDGAFCDGRECVVFGCDADFSDCDENAPGCETNTLADEFNCGQCGTTCTGPNQLFSCTDGSCECAVGFDDCDGNAFSGCESNTFTDPSRCGSCTTSCFRAGQNGQPQCNVGACSVQCQPDWGNCGGDGDALTCETQLNSPSNCGGCGLTCTPGAGVQNASCGGGPVASCQYTCQPGRANCGAPDNDCETFTASDENNCGGCGLSCGAGGTCNDGQCDKVTKVVTGDSFTCVLRSSGGVACWGDDSQGQLGDGAGNSGSFVPRAVAMPQAAFDLVAGPNTACAVTSIGLFCWGDNTDGQLGTGDTTDRFTPLMVIGPPSPVRVAIGGGHTCTVTNSGAVWCWGRNNVGQLGIGNTVPQFVPLQLSMPGPASDVAAGNEHTCARANGQVYCWGSDVYGQIGNDFSLGSLFMSPTLVQVSAGAQGVFAGGEFSCMTKQAASTVLYCWGRDHVLQLGTGVVGTNEPSPVINDLVNPTSVGLGAEFGCATNPIGQVLCWGANGFGQLGRGVVNSPVADRPDYVNGLTGVQSVAPMGAGAFHACALRQNGTVWCWGDNSAGQLGQNPGGVFVTAVPTQVPGL